MSETPSQNARLTQYLKAWRAIHDGDPTAAQVAIVSRRLNQIALREADKFLSRRDAVSGVHSPSSEAIEDITATILMQIVDPDRKMRGTICRLLDAIAAQKTEEALQASLKEFNSFIVQCLQNKAHDLIFRDRYSNAVSLDAPAVATPFDAPDNPNRGENLPSVPTLRGQEETILRRLSVADAMLSLTELKRRVVRLHVFERHSLAEIAAQLCLSDNTVRSHYRRALADLRPFFLEEKVTR